MKEYSASTQKAKKAIQINYDKNYNDLIENELNKANKLNRKLENSTSLDSLKPFTEKVKEKNKETQLHVC